MNSDSAQHRLKPHPTQLVDRSKALLFEFEGRVVQAHEGDTIASALYSSGIRTFSRSFKYHRRRGLLCVVGRCPNCMMTVDDVPNVRTCIEPIRSGMSVRRQNAWPSVEYDALSVLDRLDWALPVGFYYKSLHKPKLLWKLASPIIRRIAGLGTLPTEKEEDRQYHHEYQHIDVAVIGGGPAGMSAALSAVKSGADVILIDDQTSLGGSLRFNTRTHSDLSGVKENVGYKVGVELAQSVQNSGKVETLSNATAFGIYEDNYIGVLRGNVLTKVRAKSVVVATGTQEIPSVFEKNDLPGIVLSSGLQRLIHLYGINPGSSALITTSTDSGYHTAVDLMNHGIRIAGIADSRENFPDHLPQARDLQSEGVLILTSHAASRAEGGRHLLGGVVARIVDGKLTTEERQFDCDLLAMAGGYQPASWLLEQTGASLSHDDSIGERVPRQLPAGVFVTGEVTGTHDLNALLVHGRQSGIEAASKSLGNPINSGHDQIRMSPMNDRPKVTHPPIGVENAARRFVCFCEDVTAKDVEQGIGEGFEDIQTLKRYSTVTMGPCQGKMCLKTFSRMTAEKTGATIDEIGVTTARPPTQPVPLAALAGPSHTPIKRSSIFAKHLEMGAEIIDMSPWQRAYSYTNPQEECMAVRERVGIIDVSTLGKVFVQGSDSGALLDKLYTHHFSNLRPGRVRYGIMCSDDGVIIDDGTVARITEDRYFITTSTGNIELVEEWMKWWIAGTNMCAHITNVTSGYAAINVAGPHARETLSKITDIDLTSDNFRYMRFKSGAVAGVPAMFLRIGFVGELSWELHFPAEYGEYMWDVLMEAGREYGISPFGVEAQRILRLEKKHIIVGQDTDAVTNPLETDSSWAVKLDKEDFIGKGSILAAEQRGLEKRLVGFIIPNSKIIPKDGDAVIIGGQPIGHVTSSRMSPTIGTCFGLAWVPNDLAEENREIFIRVGRQNFSANVTLKPIYDPEGKRLRS